MYDVRTKCYSCEIVVSNFVSSWVAVECGWILDSEVELEVEFNVELVERKEVVANC